MPLVVFLRGANVGGHRTFRPSLCARKLSDYEVMNVGAAGTFVVWKPGSRTQFRAALQRILPFDTEIVICDGRDLLRLVEENPFGNGPPPPNVVRFVSILFKGVRVLPPMPVALPTEGDWLVRIIGANGRFVLGEYRRHMKTIGYLGRIDKLFGAKVTTRNWNTITALVKIVKRDRA